MDTNANRDRDIDLKAATSFLAGHGRVLDRHRLALALGDTSAAARVLGALEGYHNADGGFGWGLEADLRDGSSQPGAALHAFEAMADVAATGVTSPRAVQLCDWSASVALDGGAGPFAFPVDDPAACAPFWTTADPNEPSLQITAAVVAQALRLALHQPEVAAHPWLREASAWCVEAAGAAGEHTHAIELMFTFHVLDALAGSDEAAATQLQRLAALIPPSGALPVAGGAEGETLHLLDLSPSPGTPLRAFLAPEQVDEDLHRLVAAQTADGGWHVDFDSYSSAAALEWDGCTTVQAVQILIANGRA